MNLQEEFPNEKLEWYGYPVSEKQKRYNLKTLIKTRIGLWGRDKVILDAQKIIYNPNWKPTYAWMLYLEEAEKLGLSF